MILTLTDKDRSDLTDEVEQIIRDEVYVFSYGGCCNADYDIEDRDLAARRIVSMIEEKLGLKSETG